jgi:Domain of unknown function (DUF4281)
MRPVSSFKGSQTAMSPDQLFSLANALALAGWLGLLFLPHVAAIRNVIAAAVIPCLFAAAYGVILARFFDPGGFAKFSTLEEASGGRPHRGFFVSAPLLGVAIVTMTRTVVAAMMKAPVAVL